MMKEMEKFEGKWKIPLTEFTVWEEELKKNTTLKVDALYLFALGEEVHIGAKKGRVENRYFIHKVNVGDFLAKIHDNIVIMTESATLNPKQLPSGEGTAEYSLDGDAEKITWTNGLIDTIFIHSTLELK